MWDGDTKIQMLEPVKNERGTRLVGRNRVFESQFVEIQLSRIKDQSSGLVSLIFTAPAKTKDPALDKALMFFRRYLALYERRNL